MKIKKTLVIPIISLIGGIIIATIALIVQTQVNEVISQNIPQKSLGDNVKCKATQAHLWLEEYLSGDSSINFEKEILPLIKETQTNVNAALDGDTCELGVFCKPNVTFEHNLEEVKKELIKFEELSIKRNDFYIKGKISGLQTANAGSQLDQEFDATYENLMEKLTNLIDDVNREIEEDNSKVMYWVISSVIFILGMSMMLSFWIYRKNENEEQHKKESDEKLSIELNRFSKLQDFVSHISTGQFDVNLDLDTEKDILAKTMINMRDALVQNKSEDQKRHWATEGMALFGEILRNDNDDLEKLSNKILSNLIKYLKANQGGLFIIEEFGNTQKLVLQAAYAYERKKYSEKIIELGEGLVGQAWQEQEMIYMTDIPDNYIAITSGLGGSNPNCLLIIPLKVNESIYGILEIASFKPFEDYEIDFIKRITESIASTLSSVKVNVRTAKLLNETRLMSEQLQAQEEELRQNAEEMLATQEEMSRRILELESIIQEAGK